MSVTGTRRPAPHTQTQLEIRLNGTELRPQLAADLLEVRVELGVRAIGRATLTFQDRDGSLPGRSLAIGTAVEISSVEPSARLFTGTITGVALDADATGTAATVTVQDGSYQLARNRTVATFQNQSYREVVQKLVASTSLSSSLQDVTGQFEWMLQADSALGLLDEIAGRRGLDWTVEDAELSMWAAGQARSSTPAATLEVGVDLGSFSVRQTDTGPTDFQVRGWDPEKGEPVTATARSRTEGGFRPPDERPARVTAAHEAVPSSDEASAVAAGLAAATGRVSGRGRADFTPAMQVGHLLEIRGAGGATGRYYVREIVHQVDTGSLRTSFVVGDRPPDRVTDPWRSPARVSSLRHSGLTVGIVDHLDDPGGFGRVRVQLVGLADTASSAWARVLALGGGKNHGLVVLPDVGDEVLVAFEDDDLRRPVVLGGLFSSKVQPGGVAMVENGKLVSRHLVSGAGHQLQLGDGSKPQDQVVRLALADGTHQLRISKKDAELSAPDVPLKISSGGASISFDGRGNVTIDATNLTLKARSKVRVEGVQAEVAGSGTVDVTGAKVTVSGSGQAVLKGGAVAEISGAIVKIN